MTKVHTRTSSLRSRLQALVVAMVWGGPYLVVATAVIPWAGCSTLQRPDGGTGMLSEGETVPALSARDHNGTELSLESLRGKVIVVYFYPKDATPGCTKEACAFRDVWSRYEEKGIVVLGVSRDDTASHQSFAKEHELPFSLISDEDGKWGQAFGVGSMVGMHKRVSFLVGPDGKIARVYPKVDPGVHAEQVLNDAQALASPSS